MYTIQNFLAGLQKFLQYKAEISDGMLRFRRKSDANNVISTNITEADITTTLDEFTEDEKFIDCSLQGKCLFESPVKLQDDSRLGYIYPWRKPYLTKEYGYVFDISIATPKYIFALMCFLAQQTEGKSRLSRHIRIDRFSRATGRGNDNINSMADLNELFHIYTVKASSPVECSPSDFQEMIQSYLFKVSYNQNIVFTLVDLFDNKDNLMRRTTEREGSLFPNKKYIDELISYYNQGVSSSVPLIQYLAYYHVAEFFFNKISLDDICDEIKKAIVHPSFSPHNSTKVEDLYRTIRAKVRNQNDEGVWKEKEAFLLCLKEYIRNIDTLKNAIESIDINAIKRYSEKDISFISKPDPKDADDINKKYIINFDDLNSVHTNIRNRIYSVRNAIVHSKEGEKLRYEPVKHDDELSKEIALVRAVAEEIIVNSAMDLKFKLSENIPPTSQPESRMPATD